jgi:hypothetical protein
LQRIRKPFGTGRYVSRRLVEDQCEVREGRKARSLPPGSLSPSPPWLVTMRGQREIPIVFDDFDAMQAALARPASLH